MIQIFLADGRTDGPTEGSTRGPRGPKKEITVSRIQNLDIKEEKGSFQLSATGQSIEEVSAEQKSNREKCYFCVFDIWTSEIPPKWRIGYFRVNPVE